MIIRIFLSGPLSVAQFKEIGSITGRFSRFHIQLIVGNSTSTTFPLRDSPYTSSINKIKSRNTHELRHHYPQP